MCKYFPCILHFHIFLALIFNELTYLYTMDVSFVVVVFFLPTKIYFVHMLFLFSL